MSSWWKTAKDILKGKPKGSKLIVLGVFLAGLGIALDIIYGKVSTWVLISMGICAFVSGLTMYEKEAKAKLEK